VGHRRRARPRTGALQEVGHTPRFYEIADRFEQQEESAVFLEGYALGLGLRIEEGDVDVNSTD